MAEVSSLRDQHRAANSGIVGSHAKVLVLTLVAMALLPVPVTLLRVLPAYEMHARFLVFFAPVVCLLTVGYFFYIRDLLTRFLFRSFLEPASEPDPYARLSPGALASGIVVKLQGILLTLAPVVLVGMSFYCVSRYIVRLEESVDIVSVLVSNPAPATGPSLAGQQDQSAELPDSTRDSIPAPQPATSQEALPPDTPHSSLDPAALRLQTLRTAGIQDIAFFGELTTLYIGAFACAIGAAMLMLLKEHAKEVLGVSEESLLLGTEQDLLE